MVYYCTNSQVEQVRRSLSFAIFFVYCTYLVALLFSKILKDEQKKKNMQKYAHDVTYKTIFFTIFALLARSATPYVIQSIMAYIFWGVMVLNMIGYMCEVKFFKMVPIFVQPIVVLTFAFSCLIDDWNLFKMSNIYINIDNSKIMIAAAFVQYVVYCVFYLIFRDYNPPQDANSTTSPNFDQDSHIEKSFRHKQPNKLEIPDDAQAQQGSEEADMEVKANEISVEMGGAPSQAHIQKHATKPGPTGQRNDQSEEDEKPTAHEILDRFPKILHYYFAAIILCASMSPTMFAVVIAWIAVGFRIAQMISAMFRKMGLVVVFYILAVACTIFLFCNAMFHS